MSGRGALAEKALRGLQPDFGFLGEAMEYPNSAKAPLNK